MPQHFEERDMEVLHALMRSHPLGTWVAQADGQLIVNHIIDSMLNAIAGLHERGDGNSQQVAALVQRHTLPKDG